MATKYERNKHSASKQAGSGTLRSRERMQSAEKRKMQRTQTDRGAGAKKSLGQNFLQDEGIASRIVAALAITPEDAVIEIGPGAGALTRHIRAAKPELLWLLEKDYHWAQFHQNNGVELAVKENTEETGNATANSAVVLTDALLFPWERLSLLSSRRSWKIIGNLPYNVATPIMWAVVSRVEHFERAVFMIQKEVGERICAEPCTEQYGPLSVWMQSFCMPKRLFTVPRNVFLPQPHVDSAVMQLTALPCAQRNSFPHENLEKILQIAFAQRRKQFQTLFKNVIDDTVAAWFEQEGLPLSVRAESFTPKQFQSLARCMNVLAVV